MTNGAMFKRNGWTRYDLKPQARPREVYKDFLSTGRTAA